MLVYLANQAAIEFHIWPSTVDDMDHPDRLVLDVDPPDGVEVATPARASLGRPTAGQGGRTQVPRRGNHLEKFYWEVSGNSEGRPVIFLHGGPGGGCGPGSRRFFDPDVYWIVVFHQRGCGNSRPLASDPGADLSVNTTEHLLADIEALRRHLGIARWTILGVSWDTTLGLAMHSNIPTTSLVWYSAPSPRRRAGKSNG